MILHEDQNRWPEWKCVIQPTDSIMDDVPVRVVTVLGNHQLVPFLFTGRVP